MLQKFLRESSLAATVKVGAGIIVHRRSMNADDLKGIEEDGLNLPLSAEEECELEVEGLAVCRGKDRQETGRVLFQGDPHEQGGLKWANRKN